MNEGINQIGQIASGLVTYEFDYITGDDRVYELQLISGSLSGKLGELNILLNQSFHFTGDDGNPNPRLQQEERDILEQLYLRDYNTKQAQKLLRGIYDTAISDSIAQEASPWIELSEGDTTIKRSPGSSGSSASSRITMSKDFKALSEEARKKIDQLVSAYNMYGSEPRQVLSDDCCGSCNCSGEEEKSSASKAEAPSQGSGLTQGSGPQGSGPQGSGPQGSGPQGSGPQGSGPQGSGPQGSGPQGSGPQGSGPQGSGPQGSGPSQGSGPQGSGPSQGSGPATLNESGEIDDEIVSDI